MNTFKLTDSQAESVLRAVHLQVSYWLYEAPRQDASAEMCAQQVAIWSALEQELMLQYEGDS